MKSLKLILTLLILLTPSLTMAEKLSNIESTSSWIYLYDENGRRYKTLSATAIGEVKGWSDSFFIAQSPSWIYIYDASGKRLKTLSRTTVGDVTAVSGNTFTSRKGSWVFTYDKTGKRLNTRAAH